MSGFLKLCVIPTPIILLDEEDRMPKKPRKTTKKQSDQSQPKISSSNKKVSPPKHLSTQLIGQKKVQLPIIAIGSSAGGLEALNAFFKAMPVDSDFAFVVISHLDPDRTSMLPELIQHKTAMPVIQVIDNQKIEVNSIYVIPPNKEMGILNGILHTFDMPLPHGLNRPIDSFFRSLAQDQGNNAIAMVLSGTGTDGSLGLRDIKGEAGIIIAQDPQSAKYDGMPRNAIATGLVDYVLAPEKMPEKLMQYVKHWGEQSETGFNHDNDNVINALQKIYFLLRTKTTHDFSLYKKNTIFRRIERRILVHQLEDINSYVRYLQESETEISVLFKELLIGVTSFFRDKEAFESLKNDYLPKLLQDKPDDYQIRVWVPGCSSGEEAYSIAITLYECMAELKRRFSIQIFATDIDEAAIEKARHGRYPESIAMDVSAEQLKTFFSKDEDHYQVKKLIREMVVFAPQNIIKDPPFTKLDLLCCRNLLIYFGPELQKKLLPIFHYSLKAESLLFLGSSESIGTATDLFSFVDKKWKIFKSVSSHIFTNPSINLAPSTLPTTMSEKKIAVPQPVNVDNQSTKLLRTLLSESDLSPRIVIDNEANILYIHGRTGKYLEPAQGATSTNIIDMARTGLKPGLSNGIRQVSSKGETVEVKHLQIKNNDDYVTVNLLIKPFAAFQLEKRGLMLVIFEEINLEQVATPQTHSAEKKQMINDEVKSLKDELQYTKENLQSTIEELETSNEELKSANEELQSTNEELQSSNEELETSKEELQSLNEESSTVNSELQSRIDQLVNARDDIKNLLDATEIASVFLDIDLKIRRFTPRAVAIFPLTEADIGRPIEHFASTLKDVDLHRYTQQVLSDLAMKEEEVLDRDDKVFRMRIRPYRTINNVIDGIVITFEDITNIKKIESELSQISNNYEENLLMMSKVFMDGADPMIIEDLDGIILNANDETSRCYGWSHNELVGKDIKVLIPSEFRDTSKHLLKQCISNKKPVRNLEGLRQHKSGQVIKVLLTYSLLTNTQGEICAIATIAKNYPIQTPDNMP